MRIIRDKQGYKYIRYPEYEELLNKYQRLRMGVKETADILKNGDWWAATRADELYELLEEQIDKLEGEDD